MSNSSLVIQNGRYVRGGNTIIFNHQLLDKFDHPKIPRRGDSIWALMVKKNGGLLGHFLVPLRHIRDIRNANWSPQSAQQNWLRRLEVDLIGASFQRWYANTDSTVTPEQILVERCERQLRVFNSCLSRLDNLPPEISSVMREYIQSGIGRTTKLRNNPSVFSAYHQCVNSNTIHAPEYNLKERGSMNHWTEEMYNKWIDVSSKWIGFKAIEDNPKGLKDASEMVINWMEQIGFEIETYVDDDAPYRPVIVAKKPPIHGISGLDFSITMMLNLPTLMSGLATHGMLNLVKDCSMEEGLLTILGLSLKD